MSSPVRRASAAAERNRQPMLDVLRRVLPASGRALEIASGTGQHVAWFASHLPAWTWLPTDADPSALASIAAWCAETAPVHACARAPGPAASEAPGHGAAQAGLPNVEPPRRLDVRDHPWPLAGRFDAIVCANMLHISPWPCCAALMQGAAHWLARGGVLVLYGPFIVDGEPLAPSNAAFDADLRARDPAWGLRTLDAVATEARDAGLRLRWRIAMPAHNQILVFEETS